MKLSLHKLAKKINLDNRSIYLRKLIIECLQHEQRGHVGSSMSLVEIIRVLYDDIMKFNSKKPNLESRDRFILSKGHGCLALYIMLYEKKFISKKQLISVGKFDSILGGHPEHIVPGIEFSTGALGHGFSIACGVALSAKIKKQKHKIFALMGDGEINEGSVWESALSVSKYKLNNLITIIDYNKFQSYGPLEETSNMCEIKKKWESFGFDVIEINGHDVNKIKQTFKIAKNKGKKPVVVICYTIKGKGLKFAENISNWHHRSSIDESLIKKMSEKLQNYNYEK
jgi:transketolase